MTEPAGRYAGMTVEEARKAVVADLRKRGVDVPEKQEVHRAPVCERSKTPVEFVSMEDWYMRQLDARGELRKLAAEMAFHPDRHRQLLLSWIDGLTIDWPISRRRYYHTEIPLWYCKRCGHVLVPEPGPYYRPWRDPPPFLSCPKCGGAEFQGEDRVFDTWMDSSNSNLIASLYMRDDAFFKEHFPAGLRPQGRDIVRNWLYYTTLKSYYVTGGKPFHHVWIHGMGLDARGRAMHRTLGNYTEPEPVLRRDGADAFRFWAASTTTPGDDFRVDETKIAGAKKFLSKLWNVSRFISSFDEPPAGKLLPSRRICRL